ncbi:Hypothetical predicted protein [Cloeon dipterum]|uniref:DNA repair protein RAD50 n=2 Tax=Cloeon dipterum TaxID=197152 RepID=A0A8S1BZJ2_9INSE|nr:Hypothetical predicted protein [Cloeon dipterum]
MASIHSLSIRGIRSFGIDAEDEETIKFMSPITCIVGQNGCGKTTIIESLRYATTGQAPPGTDKGKSFVYDPKLSRAGESLGQVKLRFNSTRNTVMQIKRSIRCAKNRSDKLEMKTLEPTLEYIDKQGEKHVVSGRCQDVSSLVYDNLGVSQAILDNVIFCHQDESNWPLDESKKLKEKFDDIFDAAKYNKASEALTKLIKKKIEDLRVAKAQLAEHKINWEFVQKKRQELDRDTKRYENGQKQINEMKAEVKPMEEELRQIHHREGHYNELNTKISTLDSSKNDLIGQRSHLKKQIKNLHRGSKIDLQEEIHNFEAGLKAKEREIVSLEEEISKLNDEEKSSSNRIQQEQLELGKLTQEEKNHQDILRNRFETLKSFAKELNKSVDIENPQDKLACGNAYKAIESGIKEFELNFQKITEMQESVENSLEKDIYGLRDELSKSRGLVGQLEKSIKENEEQLRSNSTQVKKVDSGLAKVSILENRLSRVEEELKAEEEHMNVEQSQREIVSTQSERKDLEDEKDVITKEINALQLAKGHQTEADIYKKNIEEKTKSISMLMMKHQESLNMLFPIVPESKLKSAVDEIVKKNEKERAALQTSVQEAKNSQYRVNADLDHCRKQVADSEKKLQFEVNNIKEECGDQDLDSVLRETEAELQKATDQKGILDSSCVMFRRYVALLKKDDPCCPLCHRDFAAQKESEKLIQELNSKMKDYPSKMKECAESQQKLQQKLSQLQQLIPSQKKIDNLRSNEIPQLRDQIEDLEMSLAAANAEESSASGKLKVPEKILSVAETLRSEMALVDKFQEEIYSLREKLLSVEDKLELCGSTRSLEEAQADQNRITLAIKKLQKAAEEKQNALNQHQQKVNEMKDRKNNLTKELLEIRSGEQQKTQLMDLVKKLTEKDKQLKKELKGAEGEIEPKQRALASAEEEKSIVKAEHSSVKEKHQKELLQFRSRMTNLKDVNKVLEKYEARNLSQKLENLKSNVAKLTDEKEKLVLKKESLASKNARLQKDMATQNMKQRDLNDNLRLIDLEEQISGIDNKLSELKDELGSLNYGELKEKIKKLSRSINKIDTEIARMEGSQLELMIKIEEIKTELKKDTMMKAENRYKEEQVKIVVDEQIIKDMKTFFLALSNAIIHFHKERMEEVNRIIRELWVSIYKGSDIDHIEIKTESEEKQTTSIRRSYNYRVIMVKKGSELDMRGRCSAGQKMLASLVIRIALAETFSASCGILALDEPTTNLDACNVESLAASLIDLAQSHRMQKNFQLLVITHDEEFIEKLTQAQLIDGFYRISRDAQGHSKIKKFRVGYGVEEESDK